MEGDDDNGPRDIGEPVEEVDGVLYVVPADISRLDHLDTWG